MVKVSSVTKLKIGFIEKNFTINLKWLNYFKWSN